MVISFYDSNGGAAMMTHHAGAVARYSLGKNCWKKRYQLIILEDATLWSW